MSTLPDTVRLLPTYDPDRLLADLRAVEAKFRNQTNPTEEHSDDDAGGWDVLLLRCPGGDPETAGRGDGGMEDFSDTPYLDLTPYVREILDSLPAPVRGVRFSSLAAGGTVGEHSDRPYGLPVGWVRLHIPVVTTDDAVLTVNGGDNRWKAGEFWYANFGLPHSLYNNGPEARVHLIIDCYVSPGLFDLFPTEITSEIAPDEVMWFREELPVPDEFSQLVGPVNVPQSFLQPFTEPPSAEQWKSAPDDDVEAMLELRDGRFVLSAGGRDAALAYIGSNEFRSLCWSQERTVQVARREGKRHMTFCYRYGSYQVHAER